MPPLLADFIHSSDCKLICEKSLTLPEKTRKESTTEIEENKKKIRQHKEF